MDLESGEFDANEYFLDLLKNNNLKQLVDKNLNIQSQIKSFDHDIQSMVSDNYSKFISSIDIVKKMKDNIDGVEKKMEKLETSINKINTLALKIDSTLETKRSEIKKLDLINKDLSNLKKLCEFPNLLKKELEKYKTSLRSVSRDASISRMNAVDYPVEVLDKLGLDKTFRESAEYYLECAEKLNLYKEEKLIKPLYEESKQYVEEVKHILYSLTMNKNLDKDAKDVFFNYLCFDKEHGQTIKSYFRNLSEKYITKLRNIFFVAQKESEKFKTDSFEVEYNGERFTIESSNALGSAAKTIAELQKENQKAGEFFQAMKSQAIKNAQKKLSESTLLAGFEGFFSQFKEDLSFYLVKVKALLKEEDYKVLLENYENIIKTVFEDISKRMSSIAPPLFVHRLICGIATKKLEEIVDSLPNADALSSLFSSILKKFQIEMVWICQLESLDSVIQCLLDCKVRTASMHIKNVVLVLFILGQIGPSESQRS